MANCTFIQKNDASAKSFQNQGLDVQLVAQEWCAKAMPYVNFLKEQEKALLNKLHQLLEEDLYAALPELKPPVGTATVSRTHRGIGALILSTVPGLITLAVESLSSWIRGKQQKHINEAVSTMRQDNTAIRNRLQQYSNDFVMYGKYNIQTLNNIIATVNSLHRRQSEMEKLASHRQFGQVVSIMEAMTFNFDLQLFLKVTKEEHVDQFLLMEQASRDLLKGIATLSQGRLPQELFPDS